MRGEGRGSERRGEQEHCREGDPLMPQQCYIFCSLEIPYNKLELLAFYCDRIDLPSEW